MRHRGTTSVAILLASLMALASCNENKKDTNAIGSGNGPTGGAGSASGRTDTQATAPASETKTQ